MSTSEPECMWALGAELGEGPLWRAPEDALWLVDIKKLQIHRFDLASGEKKSFDAPAQPGFLAPLPDGKLIVGLKTGLHTFDPANGSFTLRHVVEPDRPNNRLNDGAVDGTGHLWFGSMDDGERAETGRLYRLDGQGPQPKDDGYCITNGPAFSPDGKTLYHTDTLKKIIYAFDLRDDGTLSNKRIFAEIEDGAGYPDGPVVDSEGYLWSALFAGWAVRRYSPHGKLVASVKFPCANITKIAFGGPKLTTVYATTAGKGLHETARAAQPLAGGLFRFEVDVPGQPQHVVLYG